MAWLVEGKLLVAPAENFAEIFFEKGATESKAVELDAIDRHFTESLGGVAAQILPTPALQDTVKVLSKPEIIAVLEVFTKATFGPALSASESFNIVFVSVGKGSELVESHMDIGADATLDLHGLFGTDEIGLTVERINEADAFVSDVSETFIMSGIGNMAFFFHGDDFTEARTKRHDLEAARVGKGRAEPRLHSFVFGCNFWRCLRIGF